MLWFSRAEFDRYDRFKSHASVRKVMDWEEMCNVEISVPTYEEQRKIVEAYAYEIITNRILLKRKINDNLEYYLSCFFHYLFDDDRDRQECTIGDYGEIVGGATPSTANSEFFCSNGIIWLTPKDLTSTGQKFIYKGETDIFDEAYKNCSTKLLPKGTVLLTSRAPVGTVVIAMTELCTNQRFKSIIPNQGIGTEFVYYFLKENKALLDSHASGTTFMEISGNVLKKIPAFISSENRLKKFNEYCNAIFPIQSQNEEEIRQLSQLQQTIICSISSH